MRGNVTERPAGSGRLQSPAGCLAPLKRVARIDPGVGCRISRFAARLGGRNTGAKASAAVGSQPLRHQSNRPPGDARHGNWVVRLLTSPVTRPNCQRTCRSTSSKAVAPKDVGDLANVRFMFAGEPASRREIGQAISNYSGVGCQVLLDPVLDLCVAKRVGSSTHSSDSRQRQWGVHLSHSFS